MHTMSESYRYAYNISLSYADTDLLHLVRHRSSCDQVVELKDNDHQCFPRGLCTETEMRKNKKLDEWPACILISLQKLFP